jgi:hypothetical protein
MNQQSPSFAASPVPTPTEDTTYLGPARVLRTVGNQFEVELGDADATKVLVRPAFTFPYVPTAEDSLLVLGQDGQHFAVGVLSGSGPGTLHFPGDVSIHAVDGKLTLASDEVLRLRAPRVTLRAGILRTIADEVVEKSASFRRWVRGLMATRAGRSRRVIDGDDTTRCENSTTLAKDTVTVDGDQLHLGH